LKANRKDVLTVLKKWHNEGLLDKNFATIDDRSREANITSGKSGATIGNTGGGILNIQI
jgi:putative aldouronate transport system substrate-binding protein